MTFGYISMDVPTVFSQSSEENGMYKSSGPNTAIVVSPLVVDMQPSEWTEELVVNSLEAIYGELYSDLKLEVFEGDVNMNGNPAVYYALNGTTLTGGDELLAHVLLVYNADLTAVYAIELNHGATDAFFSKEVNSQIINSVALAEEAQHLAYGE